MNSVRLDKLSDHDLLARTKALVGDEHAATIQILHHLNEIERRKLDLDLGYSSLFDYCVNCLEYSASAAGRRILAARCIRRYPAVLELLEARELSLSTIAQIAPILTDKNCASILERVRGASHREVERVACEYRPPIKFRDRIQPVRVAAKASAGGAKDTPGAGSEDKKVRIEQKLLVRFLASDEVVKKFEEVKALLSASNPGISISEVLEVLVNDYLDRHSHVARNERREARKRTASPDSRRRERDDATKSRHIPEEIRDEIFVRDRGQCAYVAHDGTRCSSTKSLQIDHIRPFAAGGGHDSSNLRLLCAAHNKRVAERALGAHVMTPYWRRQ